MVTQAEVVSTEQYISGAGLRAWQWFAQRSDRQILLLLLTIAAIVFANSLRNHFVYDDYLLIVSNNALRDWSYFSRAFIDPPAYDVSWLNSKSGVTLHYRPFTRMLFALAFQMFGEYEPYWHLLNLLLFLGIVALAYVVVRQLSGARAVAALSLLLFISHPIHSEVVAWVNCLGDTLHALFFLAGFALYLQARAQQSRIFLLGSMVLVLAALLSKEAALCFPILVAFHQLIFIKESNFIKRTIKAMGATLPFLAMVVIYLGLRYYAYGGSGRIGLGANMKLDAVLLTIPEVILEYLRILIFPMGLSAIYSLSPVTSLASLAFWLPLLLLIAIAAIIWLRTPNTIIFAAGWILITLMPVLNLGAFRPGLIVQDRYAFLPSLGFSIALAIGLNALFESKAILVYIKSLIVGGCIAMIIGFSIMTIRQNSFWYSDLDLWKRAVAENTTSELAHCNYASALYIEGKKDEAANHYQFSLALKNGESGCACTGLGLYYSSLGDYDRATYFYERTIEMNAVNNLLVYTNLAQIYIKRGQRSKAIELLSRTTANYPDFQQARLLLEQITTTEDRRIGE
ncbi:MAG: tetratricopeptide repeat protein [Acidobacteriota bacterium]